MAEEASIASITEPDRSADMNTQFDADSRPVSRWHRALAPSSSDRQLVECRHDVPQIAVGAPAGRQPPQPLGRHGVGAVPVGLGDDLPPLRGNASPSSTKCKDCLSDSVMSSSITSTEYRA
jgi:hypothetical protein